METDTSNESEFEKVLSDEEDSTYNFQELLDALVENRDIILTVPKDQVEALRKGLSVVKAKRNAKLKGAGLAVSTDAITYNIYDDKETKDTENTKVRIKLGPRVGINVIKMELPDEQL